MGKLSRILDITVSEAVVMGLLLQGVNKFIVCLWPWHHRNRGSVAYISTSRRIKVYNVETKSKHPMQRQRSDGSQAKKLRLLLLLVPALSSTGCFPCPAPNGLGVWYILGDETTEDEGPNFQQIPIQNRDNSIAFLAQ